MRHPAFIGFLLMGLCTAASVLMGVGLLWTAHEVAHPPFELALDSAPATSPQIDDVVAALAPRSEAEETAVPAKAQPPPLPAVVPPAPPSVAERVPPGRPAAALEELVEEGRQQNDRMEAFWQGRADEVARQEAAADERAARRAEALQALRNLRNAQVDLATGDTEGVDGILARAETVLDERTRVDLEAARAALAQEDLYRAREDIGAALAERHRP
jgi:hypothetical protein